MNYLSDKLIHIYKDMEQYGISEEDLNSKNKLYRNMTS